MKKLYLYFCLLLTSLSFGQIINFPDVNFKAKLLQADVTNQIAFDTNGAIKIDSNNNGEIEISEANIVSELFISNSNIYDLTGIENFTSLYALDCSYNNLTSFNYSLNTYCNFNVSHNQITNINLSGAYSEADYSYNIIQNVTLNNTSFGGGSLNLNNNPISSFNIIGNAIFSGSLLLENTLLTEINITGLQLITGYGILNLSNNSLTKIISNGHTLNEINLTNNNSNYFDLTEYKDPNGGGFEGNSTFIKFINCTNLSNIYAKNGFNFSMNCWQEMDETVCSHILILDIQNCPNLNYICVDEGEKQYIQTRINQLGLQNQVQVNSYCSFTPGGTFYTLNGSTSTDYNNNSCGTGSQPAQNIKYAINDGTTTNYFFGNTTGNYSLPVGAGTYTVTPVLDNPTNYLVNPPSYSVAFPTTSSPFIQNFCIQKNPTVLAYNLNIVISPLTNAIPGFDATYRIWFKNTGNITLFGDVELNFNDALMDYVSSTQAPLTTSAGYIKWNFVLGFLQEGYIDVTFNLNTPMETPPLNANDILTFNASIVSNAIPYGCGDSFELNQTVVNSYDPNDKTCLLGNDINTSMIGQYVPYMIRFENTGTFPAQNIVVKDMIDTSKFDISTLQVLSSSHEVKTRITGNKVEFIFENINLPYNDATNDGFVVFKLKSLPTLQTNDVITNQASIYFDYNFPIETNTASSTFRILSNETFVNSNLIKIYPVPTSSVLNITNDTTEEIKSIEIYNTLGQLVQKEIGSRNFIDVSKLQTGNYLLKINTSENKYSKQFIKE